MTKTIVSVGGGLLAMAVAVALVVPAQAQTPVGCTLTQGYWKNHSGSWPQYPTTYGLSLATGANDVPLTGMVAILRTAPRGDATYILSHQLIAALLNLYNGADAAVVSQAIEDARTLLGQYPLGSNPQGADRDRMIALANTLDQFNNGLLGVPHCGDDPTPNPTPTPTPANN